MGESPITQNEYKIVTTAVEVLTRLVNSQGNLGYTLREYSEISE